MPETPFISELWKMKIYYKGTSGRYKSRPILIVNFEEENGLYTIQEITSVSPSKTYPTFFDQFKKPLYKWDEYGLDEFSYLKTASTNTHRIERVRLIKKIGDMDEKVFIEMIDYIHSAKHILIR